MKKFKDAKQIILAAKVAKKGVKETLNELIYEADYNTIGSEIWATLFENNLNEITQLAWMSDVSWDRLISKIDAKSRIVLFYYLSEYTRTTSFFTSSVEDLKEKSGMILKKYFSDSAENLIIEAVKNDVDPNMIEFIADTLNIKEIQINFDIFKNNFNDIYNVRYVQWVIKDIDEEYFINKFASLTDQGRFLSIFLNEYNLQTLSAQAIEKLIDNAHSYTIMNNILLILENIEIELNNPFYKYFISMKNKAPMESEILEYVLNNEDAFELIKTRNEYINFKSAEDMKNFIKKSFENNLNIDSSLTRRLFINNRKLLNKEIVEYALENRIIDEYDFLSIFQNLDPAPEIQEHIDETAYKLLVKRYGDKLDYNFYKKVQEDINDAYNY